MQRIPTFVCQTPNPKPQTLLLKTRHPKPETRNPLDSVAALLLPVLFAVFLHGCASPGSLPDKQGYLSLFDGQTLNGWKAPDMSYWTIEDGAITATISEQHPLAKNSFLVWQGGEIADFELKLKFRLTGSQSVNGGFQFRSKLLPDFDVAGYQVDNNRDTDWVVRLYDEHGRETLAWRGESARYAADGKRTVTNIDGVHGVPATFKLEDWHEYDLTAIGSHLVLKVNGVKVAEVFDGDLKQQDFRGILALQLHSGLPQKAQFKDIQLKRIQNPDIENSRDYDRYRHHGSMGQRSGGQSNHPSHR